ncbi:putative beta-glucosidase I [Colletotrichum sp. SAR 10_96]|nr:putative beta-glucosidase I [Colletotrichum sp. SAR 10_96]
MSANWTNSYTHLDDPIEMFSPVYQGLTCLPPNIYDSGNCTMGGFPWYVINASTPEHIQEGVKFAKETGIRLMVKNTGHDFSGKSGGGQSLSIWTHYLKDVEYITEMVDEVEGYSGPAFKCGTGVQAFEIYRIAHEHGKVVVGGEGQTVGVMGGYIQGGGHSPLSSIYGTGADQALAFEVVTADGRFITADHTQNSDLFWALRGGGGSTFGIATSVTVKAFPDVPTTAAGFKFSTADGLSNDTFWSGVRSYFDYFIDNADNGTYSYFIMLPNNPSPGNFLFQMTPFFAPNKTAKVVESLLNPWFTELRELGIDFDPNITEYASFYPAWKDFFPLEVVEKVNVQSGSRLFPRKNFESEDLRQATFDAIRTSLETNHVFVGFNIKATSWQAWVWPALVYLVGLTCGVAAVNCKEKYRLPYVLAFCATGIEILRYVSGINMNYAVKDTLLKGIIIQCMGAVVMVLREGFVLTEEQKRLPWPQRARATYKIAWNGRFINTARQAPVYHLIKDQDKERQVPSAVIEKRNELAERKAQKATTENDRKDNEVAPVTDTTNKQVAVELWKRFSTHALKIWRNHRLRWMLEMVCRILLIIIVDNAKDIVIDRYLGFVWTDIEDHKSAIIRRFLRGDHIEPREFWVRVYFAFESMWAAYNWYNRAHLLCALFFVGLGIDEPEEWPPMFGDIRQAWNIRRFWSKYFDRLIYRTVCGTGEMMMQAVGLGRGPFMGKKRWLLNCLVFTISGFFHAYTDYLAGITCGFWWEVFAWVANFVIIAFETLFLHYLQTYCPRMLAAEAKEKGCHVILAPTVCLQRSPLIGRGFEAFAEDPFLSGTLASAYISGVQTNGVGVSIKHYAAHDQSTMSIEDSIRVSERTMREMHLLPFQITVKNANPWCFMTAYHRINGTHASENPWLLGDILRKEWGWDGLIMSDWFGTYSTSEAVNAGLDLEMPGPARWRGELLMWAVLCRKVKEATIDARVQSLLNLINKVQPALKHRRDEGTQGDTEEKRQVCRKVASNSIVLLKNERSMLPLNPSSEQTVGLIGPAVRLPAVSGGGSADLVPYYVSTPLDAIVDIVGEGRVKTAIGCHGHLFTPLLSSNVTVPGTNQPGYILDWFEENFEENPDATPLHTTTTTQAQMYFADSLPKGVPSAYWLRVKTCLTATKTAKVQLGLCVIGKGRLYVDGKQVIDLFTSQPKKTMHTPMFNQASMELTADVEVEAGKAYEVCVVLRNEAAIPGVGALNAGGLRIGCCEKIDKEQALDEAVRLAKSVDTPIVIAGLNADYESEAVDRKSLDLPPGIDELIERVVAANPSTSGCPIAMPWIEQATTLVHAWFGGQETGNAMADVLFGKVNPSGRLSVTFPKRIEDTPAFLTFGKGQREIMYGEGVFIGHRYYEKVKTHPLFYFGHGLSYTTFEYSNLQVPKRVRFDNGSTMSFEITVDVHNAGLRNGLETVQVYIQDIETTFDRPRKELKGFTKVWVAKGDTVTAKVTLDKYALSYWNEELEQWLAEKGTFRVIISKSADPEDEMVSAEIELEKDFRWQGL